MTSIAWRVLKKVIGIVLVVFGLIAFFVPLVPFAWVALIGLELLGVRVAVWGKIRAWFQKQSPVQ